MTWIKLHGLVYVTHQIEVKDVALFESGLGWQKDTDRAKTESDSFSTGDRLWVQLP